jgi:hypothetical protein
MVVSFEVIMAHNGLGLADVTAFLICLFGELGKDE